MALRFCIFEPTLVTHSNDLHLVRHVAIKKDELPVNILLVRKIRKLECFIKRITKRTKEIVRLIN